MLPQLTKEVAIIMMPNITINAFDSVMSQAQNKDIFRDIRCSHRERVLFSCL